MNVFFFVVCIVAIVMTADTIQKYMKMKSKAPLDAPDVDETLEKMARLEERIRVLERIITEHKYDLKREIDKL